MMAKKLEQRIKALEERVSVIEKPSKRKGKSSWLKLAGWAKDDPVYDEAMRLGSAFRKSS